MAKFYGEIGYGESVETAPGIWEDVITEYNYYGDVIRNSRRLESGDQVNNDLSVGNSISIVADAYTMGQSQLQSLLESLLGSGNVYFQPPSNLVMQYPAIVYHRDFGDTEFADNKPYRHTLRYQVTVIDRSPVSGVRDKVAALPMCTYQRYFAADELNHDVFNLYF
jgi:hypothetical protein